MENTLENKSKFFAQYWGQKVLIFPINEDNQVQKVGATYMSKYGVKLRCLLLKPLSSITDEDAIEVAKLMYPKDKHNDKDSLDWGKEIAKEIIQGQTDKDVIWFAGIVVVIDYLRSNGYALPWMGLSVEQQIEYGWVKLKQ